MTSPSIFGTTTPFVTFYSFKGGVGRSMALVNVAGILAGRGFRVLVIDLDLEAPGVSYLARAQHTTEVRCPGFVDLLSDAVQRGTEADLFALSPTEVVDRYTAPYTIEAQLQSYEGGELRILPAGLLDDTYQNRLDALGLPALYQQGWGKPLVAAFKRILQESARFDLVLVDSRTGFSDESGICTRDLADALVIVMGLNRQNVEGTASFLGALRGAGIDKPFRVVLSPVPNGEDELLEERERVAETKLHEAWGEPVPLELRIPYHPRLALTEEPHVFRRRRGYLFDAYVRVYEEVLVLVGADGASVESRVSRAIRGKRYEEAAAYLHGLLRLNDGVTQVMRISSEDVVALARHGADAVLGMLATRLSEVTWWVGSCAEALAKAKLPIARVFYEAGLEARPDDAGLLGAFASFLRNVRLDYDRAEALYERSIAADPTNAVHLGNFANLLWYDRQDHDRAEALYERAIAADPIYAVHLSNFANFLHAVRQDYDRAEALYERSVAADPNYANGLGNFAAFLHYVRQDHDRAEALYERAIAADPTNAVTLGNFANLLHGIRQDHDRAEALYERSVAADPNYANGLGNFANLLRAVRQDYDRAEALYERSIAADPNDANHLSNFAQLRFIQGRDAEAVALLDRALAGSDLADALRCELHFYAYAHLPDRRDAALAALAAHLRAGHRSPGWDLSANVRVATEAAHPAPDLLAALAQVISAGAPLVSLDAYSTWAALQPG